MKRTISCLLLSLLLSFPLRGQIHTKQLPVADRLPSNSIKRLLQDSEGYIWMATLDGICRYDAYRVMNFRLNYMAGTVDAPSINHISEDSCRRIWIAHSKGIILLDKRNYSLSALNDDAFRGKNIKSVFTASNGDVWVGAETNLYCYPAAGKPLGEKKLYGNFAGDINSFCEDREGALWFTTWREGMYRLRQNDTLFVRYPPIGANDNPHKIYQDNTGQHWVCTWNDGLYRFHPHRSGTGMYERIRAVDKDSALHGNIFFNVVRDDTYGYIWALSHTGMYVLKPGIRPGDFVEAGIPPAWSRITNLFYDIMKDRDGNLWLGSVGGGALTIELSDSRFRHYNLDEIPATTGLIPNITALCESKDRVLWMNQNRLGICLLYPGSGEIMSFSNLPALNKIEHLRSVNCISRVDGSEEIWAGASYDPVIYCFHQSGKNVLLKTTVNLSDLSPSATSPLRILEDRSGHVWVHTEDELFCRNLQGQWSLIERVEGKISGLTEGRDSSIWVSTCEQGLYRFTLRGEKQHLRVETSRLPDNNIQILSSDSCRIWIITGDNRLFAFLPEHPELFREYTLEHLPSGEAVNDLVSDPMGHLWISTNKCVIEFNPSNGASVDYSRADGLPVNMFIKGSTATTASGEILFGGNQGVCRFIPSEALDKSSRNTPVKICDIKVNNHSIYEENKAMDKPNQSLRLRPSDKTVELAFSSLYYMSPGKIRYAYRLDGVDNDWIYAAEDRRFAVYNQLRKGRYTFRVKATGKNGLWDEQETEINIIKLPDFYETPQACLLYICLVCGIAFVSLRVASNRIKLRNKLKIAQIEKEKSEELIQTKQRYFTNISHDLLTPLSIMSCVVDEACPSVEQTEVLRSNIDRLKRLLQQILDFRKVESGNMKLKVSQ